MSDIRRVGVCCFTIGETMTCVRSGSDSYGYTQDFSFSPAGQWQPADGSGSASGSGSITSSYLAFGGYSAVDPNWSYYGQSGTARTAANLGDDWSGSTSASGQATNSFGYGTSSVFSSSSGWSSTGSAWATLSGSTSSSFSAGSPFASSFGSSDDGGWLSGVASGSGSDWSSYSYTEQTESPGAWGSWSAPSGSGWASGGSSASWSYAGNGSYWEENGGGTLNGTMGESGSESYAMGYGTTATLASNTGFWVQSGTGSIAANSLFGYSYSGAGGGMSGTDDGYGDTSSTSWNLNEHGSGGGTSDYYEWLTLQNGAWSGSPSLSSTDSNESVYSYNGSTAASYAYSGETQNSTTTISDDEITTTDSDGAGLYPTVTTTYGGSGSANGSNDSSGSGGAQDDTWVADWYSQGSGGTSLSYTTASGGGSLESSGMLSFWYELGWGPGLVSAAEPGAIPGQVAFGAGPLEGDTDGLKISGGVDFPGTADYYAPTLGYPQVPPYCEGPSFVFGRPTLPGSLSSMVAVNMQASSLAGLAPSPVMVNAVWGMAFTAQAGESPVGGPGSWHMAYGTTAAPQTPFATGQHGGRVGGLHVGEDPRHGRGLRRLERRRGHPRHAVAAGRELRQQGRFGGRRRARDGSRRADRACSGFAKGGTSRRSSRTAQAVGQQAF